MNNNVNYLMAVAGGYLLYLAFKLVLTYIRGEASLGFFNVVIGVIFVGIGGWILLREWRNYRGTNKKDKK